MHVFDFDIYVVLISFLNVLIGINLSLIDICFVFQSVSSNVFSSITGTTFLKGLLPTPSVSGL